MAPKVAAMDTWRPHATVRINLAVPGRPIRSLVAEDRSAGGVRDQTGRETRPEPGLVHVWSTRHRNRAVRNGHQRYIVCAGPSAILR
jgi:hypothetical protein